MLPAVILALHGILADYDPIPMHDFRRVVEEEGLTFTDAEYTERYLPLNDRDCFREVWQKHGLDLREAELVKLIQRKSAYYFGAIEGKDVLFEGAADAIRAAASRGPVRIAPG